MDVDIQLRILEAAESVARLHEEAAIQAARPFYLIKPKLTLELGKYFAQYGDVLGVGKTPEEAAKNFDKVWRGES